MSTAGILVFAPTHSQQASVLVGGVHARYADSVSGSAGVTSLRLSGASATTAGVFAASVSKFSSGEWVTQVSGFGTALLPVAERLNIGISGGAVANRIQGGSWNGQMVGGMLGALSLERTFLTVGASLGQARTVLDSTISMSSLTGRVQQVLRGATTVSGGATTVGSDTIRYTDLSMALAHSGPALRASLSVGVRVGDLADDPWLQGQLEYDILPRLTYELRVGRYPQSLVGFTDGMYLTTGIRVRLSRMPGRTMLLEQPVAIELLGEGRVRIELKYAGDASSIEIVGGWNGWLPLQMDRVGDDKWTIELPLEPGFYQYALVVDGNTWTVPDGVASEPDDFGGEVATLFVKGSER